MPKNRQTTPLHDVNETVSMNECTGLMPAGLGDQGGGTALGELYSVHPPEAPTDKRSRAKKAAVKSLKL